MAAHSATGNSFIDSLQGKADAAVSAAGVPGVSAAMVRKPLLNRNVVLSGAASEADRSRVMEAAGDPRHWLGHLGYRCGLGSGNARAGCGP
ncbi:MAG: hypothetical protein HZY74_04115 [Brevundimonas sp.]|nr:MAG: hypothetical protein HZY74_04115 [Brevundimonas sp.]